MRGVCKNGQLAEQQQHRGKKTPAPSSSSPVPPDTGLPMAGLLKELLEPNDDERLPPPNDERPPILAASAVTAAPNSSAHSASAAALVLPQRAMPGGARGG